MLVDIKQRSFGYK